MSHFLNWKNVSASEYNPGSSCISSRMHLADACMGVFLKQKKWLPWKFVEHGTQMEKQGIIKFGAKYSVLLDLSSDGKVVNWKVDIKSI